MTSFTGGTRSLWGVVDSHTLYYDDAVSRKLLAAEFVRGVPPVRPLSLMINRAADGIISIV